MAKFSQNTLTTAINSVIEWSHQFLEIRWSHSGSSTSYRDFSNQITKIIDSDDKFEYFLSDLEYELLTENGSQYHHFLKKACVLRIQSERMLKSMNFESALEFTSEISYICGIIDGLKSSESIENSLKAYRDGPSKGGEGKKRKTTPARMELIRLLQDLRPENGWPSQQEAIRKIYPFLDKFINYEEAGLKPDNLEKTMERWMSKEPDIRIVFDRLKRP